MDFKQNQCAKTIMTEKKISVEEPTEQQAIDIISGRALIEISGNVTKEKIDGIKDLKVNFISSGALTHSAPIMDLSLKHLHAI